MVTFSAYRYTSSSWGQGWRDSSDFNEILHFFFDSILSTTLIPLLRRWLPSLFIQTGTGFATTSVQSTLLTSPASARTRLLPPTSLSICVVLRETVPWFPSSSLATMGHINLRPRNTVSPSSCLYITCLQPSMVSLESQPSSYGSQVISARFELNDPSTDHATHPTITRHSRLSRSHGFGLTFFLGVAPDRLFTISTAPTLEQESGSNTSYTLAGMVYTDVGLFGRFYGHFWKMVGL